MFKEFLHYSVFLLVFTLSFIFANRQSDYLVPAFSYLLCLCLFTIGTNTYKSADEITLNPLTLLALLWLGWLFVPLTAHWVNSTALFGIFHCSPWVLVYCLVLVTPGTRAYEFWIIIKKLLFGLALISALLGLYQHYYLHEMAIGLFASRTTNGIFNALAALMVLAELLLTKNQFSFNLKSTFFVIVNSALLLSFSRGVLLAYSVGLFFFLGCNLKYLNKNYLYKILFLFLFSLILFLVTSHQELAHRFVMLAQEKSRLLIWKGAWNLWGDSSWYGIGLFNFKYYYKAFSLPGDNSSFEYAHNDYLQLLLETGIPGFLILIAIGFYLLLLCIRYLKRPNPDLQVHVVVTTFFTLLLVFLCHSIVDYNFYLLPMNMLLGLIIGMLIRMLGKGYVYSYIIYNPRKKLPLLIIPVLTLMISFLAYALCAFNYYSDQAEFSKNKHEYELAIAANNKALQWLEHPEIHSKQADLYIEKAKLCTDNSERRSYLNLAKQEIYRVFSQNKYYARAYFQLGLINLLFYDNASKANSLFNKAIRLDRHDSVLRFLYGQFLVQLNNPLLAKKLLGEGLDYPLAAEIETQYLALFANL